LDTLYRFDDEVKDDTHGVFTSEILKLSQTTWIATFVEGTTDKNTGLPLFSEFVWFTVEKLVRVHKKTGPEGEFG
jgi:hypothetical protein